MIFRILALAALMLFLSACSENEHETPASPPGESLKVTSYNPSDHFGIELDIPLP